LKSICAGQTLKVSHGPKRATGHSARLFSKLIVRVEQKQQLDLALTREVAQLVNLCIAQSVPEGESLAEQIGQRILQSRQICFDEDEARPAGVVSGTMRGFDVQLELGREC